MNKREWIDCSHSIWSVWQLFTLVNSLDDTQVRSTSNRIARPKISLCVRLSIVICAFRWCRCRYQRENCFEPFSIRVISTSTRAIIGKLTDENPGYMNRLLLWMIAMSTRMSVYFIIEWIRCSGWLLTYRRWQYSRGKKSETIWVTLSPIFHSKTNYHSSVILITQHTTV